MTSKTDAAEAFVWMWLPGATEPVVAGRLDQDGERLLFTYGASYRRRKNAIPVYEPELPIQEGVIAPINGLSMASCIRDGSPDAWGRRVIINRLTGKKPDAAGVTEISELTFLLQSGSDRIGALDFQASATEYIPRLAAQASLDELLEAAERVEKGLPLSAALDQALNHGTSIGGARPKALIDDDDRKFIAKFSASNDTYSVVKAEFIAMTLAAACGLNVAPVSMTRAAQKDVLLIERFDRTHMRQLEDAAGQIASFGVKLWVFLQDWGQGKALYGQRWETFAGNAGILQFFGNNDLMTMEYVSRRLGRTMVAVTREGEVGPEQSAAGLSGRSQGIELHDLLTPEEVSRQFARGDRLKRQLVIWAGYHPMILQRVEYFDRGSPFHKLFNDALAP